MIKNSRILLLLILVVLITGCSENNVPGTNTLTTRPQRDTIGFAQYNWQMDSIMARIYRQGWKKDDSKTWKMALCPHDDYTYVGDMYPEVLQNVKASTIIMLGVAHRAAALGLEDSLIFDSHTYWKGPWKDVRVSAARDELYRLLSEDVAIVSDTMHRLEHSLESMIPFLQYYKREVEIIPVLVPAMSPRRMEEAGKALATALKEIADRRNWLWGEDFAIVVTTDAVHYGTEDWGGKNYASFGCDDEGNQKARDYEMELIANTLAGPVSPQKISLFNSYTLNPADYREYIWTWCGRYCVPVALYTAYYLNPEQGIDGELLEYSTSITRAHIEVDDIGMGRTAIATDCHWVGYAAVGYR
ncbi:MAG: AmmeMemoRadiSam system protein B [Marinilabiliaceae bacterium]|jgi:AmmeMemoRadiSam system protein B|nr:AmmeMemoRadiSam system protein B [Marinilabiliaceae bacterium]